MGWKTRGTDAFYMCLIYASPLSPLNHFPSNRHKFCRMIPLFHPYKSWKGDSHRTFINGERNNKESALLRHSSFLRIRSGEPHACLFPEVATYPATRSLSPRVEKATTFYPGIVNPSRSEGTLDHGKRRRSSGSFPRLHGAAIKISYVIEIVNDVS